MTSIRFERRYSGR